MQRTLVFMLKNVLANCKICDSQAKRHSTKSFNKFALCRKQTVCKLAQF